jgi:putative transposase
VGDLFVESFNSRARDELFDPEGVATLLKAQVVVEAWRIEYNTCRPHSSLGDLTTVVCAARWTSTNQPALS